MELDVVRPEKVEGIAMGCLTGSEMCFSEDPHVGDRVMRRTEHRPEMGESGEVPAGIECANNKGLRATTLWG